MGIPFQIHGGGEQIAEGGGDLFEICLLDVLPSFAYQFWILRKLGDGGKDLSCFGGAPRPGGRGQSKTSKPIEKIYLLVEWG
jgi:hypothetical protein